MKTWRVPTLRIIRGGTDAGPLASVGQNDTLLSLERLALGGAKRRGRPPAWMAKIKEATEKLGPGIVSTENAE